MFLSATLVSAGLLVFGGAVLAKGEPQPGDDRGGHGHGADDIA